MQVRTPNFKRWFGDWEIAATNAAVNRQIDQWGLEKNKGRAWLENLAATSSQQPQALPTLESILYDADAIRHASKVVDANGEPLVVYHGTREDFAAFDGGRIKGRFQYSEGFYFTSLPSHASAYADSINNAAEKFNPSSKFIKPVAKGANLIPVFVSLHNPNIINVPKGGTLELSVDGDGGAGVRAARAAGHDGVIVKREANDEWDGIMAIAFRPDQIKSAIGNTGTFSHDSADIRFSQGYDPEIKSEIVDFWNYFQKVIKGRNSQDVAEWVLQGLSGRKHSVARAARLAGGSIGTGKEVLAVDEGIGGFGSYQTIAWDGVAKDGRLPFGTVWHALSRFHHAQPAVRIGSRPPGEVVPCVRVPVAPADHFGKLI